MSTEAFTCFSGTFTLHRRPHTPDQPLQAWDATDEYLLESIEPIVAASGPVRILIVNDTFGALAVALNRSAPFSWGDSCLAERAMRDNLRRNDLPDNVTFFPATRLPATAGDAAPYDIVLYRIPKSVAFFQEQTALLAPFLTENTLLLVGGMIKHLPAQTRELLEPLGRVDVLLAQKKSRLFQVTPQKELPPPLPLPIRKVLVPEHGLMLESGANVFAAGKLDPGGRLLMDQLSQIPEGERIADLGCGNGLLGLVVKRILPRAQIHFFDESYQAIQTAERNYYNNNLAETGPDATFHVDDVFSEYTGEPFNLILCNPPFHQGHVIGDQIAWQMLIQSRRHLKPDGQLWIVGNRHLGYHIKLKRIFGNVRQIAANPDFVVLAATR